MFNNAIAKPFAVLMLLASFSSFAYSASSWSYLVKTYPLMGNDTALTSAMNDLGKKGWELVNCTEGSAEITCIFKRAAKD
ncbi:hypothetical protein R50073_48850 (plasmid) [Maricurvus nonylphenolicus]|uniref:hypothetical protein n=1 Tax=Maricurvus nonylphenolicus TaxID=1008307 RepID=UPI0036F425BC